ncbi:MAG: bifunctional methylenetetrahydrofolate dehydrogenase/methenyltetrahydrofolate cyclohydrolase FolD [Deltaproteobacteria bacterium]|nr:bifunctional methylenetetrahydrofolate dehydrogenase/methenyltetrahydrofolate cyclohydrolase FolD [Deltaproteobacteria bacterium]
MARLIDGKAIAKKVREEVARGVEALQAERGIVPGLATILVGSDPGSEVYVRGKHRACKQVGIASFPHRPEPDITQEALLALVDELNANPEVHGILVQLPLPSHLDEQTILDRVAPEKDVDGFHPLNAGKLLTGRAGLRSCTPLGIMRLLEEMEVELEGKRALIVGRSNIVGKPMALLLMEQNATVTIAHSRTRDLPARVAEADLVVAAIGRPEFVKGAWIKEGAVVIDVGINRTDEGLVGDVEFAAAEARASVITPVPGGVGPMTIATLMQNTLEAAKDPS